jgi:hypothetical protein
MLPFLVVGHGHCCPLCLIDSSVQTFQINFTIKIKGSGQELHGLELESHVVFVDVDLAYFNCLWLAAVCCEA